MSLGVAVGLYGTSFGAAASAAGFSVLQACATSLLVFTGASQFALVGVLGAGGSVAAGVASSVLLGGRNGLYAVLLAEVVPARGARRVAAAQITIDESTAVATTSPEGLEPVGFWWTGLTVYVMWNLSTLVGAASASAIDPQAVGLDGAVGAAFLGLLWPRLREAWPVALGGAVLALVAIPLTPAGVPVLVAGLAVLPALVRR
ncbi:MAG: branched-chain amino acid transporter permease [Frankiales bacterium]|nr:branched-chain amino acid transporter permease [Frankiales bacterium]